MTRQLHWMFDCHVTMFSWDAVRRSFLLYVNLLVYTKNNHRYWWARRIKCGCVDKWRIEVIHTSSYEKPETLSTKSEKRKTFKSPLSIYTHNGKNVLKKRPIVVIEALWYIYWLMGQFVNHLMIGSSQWNVLGERKSQKGMGLSWLVLQKSQCTTLQRAFKIRNCFFPMSSLNTWVRN